MGTKKWRTNGQMGVIQRGATDVLGGGSCPKLLWIRHCPVVLNSLTLTYQSNDNSKIILILCSK